MHTLSILQVKAHTAACREVARFVNPDSFVPVKVDEKRFWWEIERDQYTSIRRFWKFNTGHIFAIWNTRKLIITDYGEVWIQDERADRVTRATAKRKTLERVFNIHKENGWYKKPSPIVAEILPNVNCMALLVIPQPPAVEVAIPIPGEIAAA